MLNYGYGGGAPARTARCAFYPELGYVCFSNLDPPAASQPVKLFALRIPDK